MILIQQGPVKCLRGVGRFFGSGPRKLNGVALSFKLIIQLKAVLSRKSSAG